jgi:AraC-like DNA-binding protein
MIYKVETIYELHEISGFEKPRHPLITVIDYSKVDISNGPKSGSFSCGFYSVNFKNNCTFSYGRQSFDHKEGTLLCTAPGQIITYHEQEKTSKTEGLGLFFHPELIRRSDLGNKINDYGFFKYSENEALHLSDSEKDTLFAIIRQIESEYNTNIDSFSQKIIISNIELLLNYCQRFYNRQFLTRTNYNKDVIADFENFIVEYINSGKIKELGLPSVRFCAEAMHLSPNYFSDLLKSETGKNAQEHIHHFVLEKAKNLLVGSNLHVNEIAFELGFEYPQNFSKLFKKKMGISPSLYRLS